MTEKRFIQVWFDLGNQNGCWNCKHDWSICEIHNIGSVGYIRGISHCALKDWEYDKEKHKNSKSKYSWYKQYKELLNENEQLKLQLQNTSDQRDEFYRGARENANRVGKLKKENEQLKKRIDRIDIILDDLNGAEYISRDDAIKALNKIDKVVR